MSRTTRQIRLAARPVGEPRPNDWEDVEEPTGRLFRGDHHGTPVLKIAD